MKCFASVFQLVLTPNRYYYFELKSMMYGFPMTILHPLFNKSMAVALIVE